MENRELISELDAAPITTPRRSPAPLESLFPSLCALPRQPPRREMLPGLSWKAVFNPSLLLFFPILAFLMILPFFIMAQMKQQAASHRTATARVVQIERFGADQVFVKYRFSSAGRVYSGGTAGLADSLMSLVKIGDPLRVGFEASQPQKSVPDFALTPQQKSSNEFPWPILFLFPLMGLFIFAPFLVPQWKNQRQARRLFAQGVLTTGKLLFIKPAMPSHPQNPARALTLIYEWKDEQNQLRRGEMKCDNLWLTAQLRPQSPVVVAYHPRKPTQSVLLEPFVG